MPAMTDYRIVAETADQIGEIPTWDEREQCLYWIDLLTPRMHRLNPASGQLTTWPTPELFSAFALREAGGFVVATRTHLAFFDPPSGAFESFCQPEPSSNENFLNDGRCDRQGRLWIGSGSLTMDKPTGFLHRLDPDHSLTTLESGITLSNSLIWSPDSTVMYFCDSTRKIFYTCDFNEKIGDISNRKEFARADRFGIPDGSIIDAEGYLWNAEFDMTTDRTTGFVVRYHPSGKLDRLIELPTCRPTAVTFGGADLDVLYVVTSRYHMSESDLAQQPAAGSVFALDVGVKGLNEPRFRG